MGVFPGARSERSPPHSPHGASSRRFGNEIILVALQVEGRHCLPGEDRAKYDLRMNGHGSVTYVIGYACYAAAVCVDP